MFEDDERKGTHRQCLPLSQRRANNNWFRSFAHPQRSKSHILRLSVFTGWLQLCCVSFGMKHSYLFPRRSCRCASSQQRYRVSFQGTSHVTPISAKPKMGKQEQLQMLQSWPISPSDISKMTLRRRRMQKKLLTSQSDCHPHWLQIFLIKRRFWTQASFSGLIRESSPQLS